ncbi:hypothetical protein [Candidatus Odyssella acanthamoebae]|uniref:Uncharacterized protein n=1 Tax=Candidatus Odyssella acanthamoebae TaxID=91604 RepID=A0A077B298_9PROT|nr:hypothetical protein [Candidatus Paracaedibacter acanthamoebae]AIK97105.1 hypothetical protein ID47_10770 [Candidatus Paracaedibacter acanthamoebae]
MKKYFFSILSILIIISPYLYASDEASSAGVFPHHNEHSSFLFTKGENEERKHERAHVLIDKGEKENKGKGDQVVPSSPARKIRPTFQPVTLSVRKEVVNYLDKKVAIPTNFELIMLYNEYYRNGLKKSRQKMYQVMQKSGIEVIEKLDNQEENTSAIFYSNKYNICFFITEDIRHFLIFSQELLTQSSEKSTEPILVNKFITDLTETLNTPSMELLNTRHHMKFFDIVKLKKLGFVSPLKCVSYIYNKNEIFFELISTEIEECEQRYKEHDNEQLFNEECNLIYNALIEQQTFKDIIKEEYQTDLEALIDIYDLMLGWGDLSRSLLLTCRLGAYNSQQDGKEFYENFIFPFLDSLFMNLKDYYFNFNTFFNDEFKLTTEESKRFHIVKYNVEGVNKTAGFALRGFKQKPQPQKSVARKHEHGCLLM